MRICLIARFFDLRNGGIGRFSTEMYNGLMKRGYDIVPLKSDHVTRRGYMLYTLVEIPVRLPRDCDVYHCLTPLEAIYVPKEFSIVTFHDLIPWLHPQQTDTFYARGAVGTLGQLIREYRFRISAKIAARCAVITCNSEQTKKELIEHLGLDESKVHSVRFGIRSDLEPKVRRDKTFRVGTLSHLVPRKRIDLLIKAFLAASIDGELVIGGHGEDLPRLKMLARSDHRIKFLGFVSDEKLVDFYNSLDLFVFPTKIEGYGLPIVEAFACKKPVVVLRDAIIPDDLKSRCTVVDDLTGFLKDPEPVQDIEANYRFAKTHDWDKCVEEHINLYKHVLEQR